MAPWGIYTLVSTGHRTYEGEKLRAALVYGETGGPRITIESIHVEMGYPSPNRVLWTAKVNLTGESPDPCPVAESYCATVEDLRGT